MVVLGTGGTDFTGEALATLGSIFALEEDRGDDGDGKLSQQRWQGMVAMSPMAITARRDVSGLSECISSTSVLATRTLERAQRDAMDAVARLLRETDNM